MDLVFGKIGNLEENEFPHFVLILTGLFFLNLFMVEVVHLGYFFKIENKNDDGRRYIK